MKRQSVAEPSLITASSPIMARNPTTALNPTTASSLPARVPAWLVSSALADANEQIRPSLLDLDSADIVSLRMTARSWIGREIGFVSNPRFTQPRAGSVIFRNDLAQQQGRAGRLRRRHANLPVYLGRLCEAPLLTLELERQLFERMNFLLHQAAMHQSLLNPDRPSKLRLQIIERLALLSQWHRDRIVEANLRLVISIVKKIVNSTNTFDELLSEGIVGLIRAVERFDFDRGFRFSTYATQVIRRNAFRTIVDDQQERQKVIGAIEELDVQAGDKDRSSAISEKRWHELRNRLKVMMTHLDRREKLIIRARFSLGSHRKVHTLQSLANRLGISKERVRQLEARAMRKLQAMSDNVELTMLKVS